MELKNQNTTQKDFKNWSELRIFLSYFRPHRKLFYLDMVSALAIAALAGILLNAILPGNTYEFEKMREKGVSYKL